MDLQGLVDAIVEAGQRERKNYHMSLGDLIDFLNGVKSSDVPVVLDYNTNLSVSGPHSYRGYYSDLAIEPTENVVTVRELHQQLDEILDTEMTGYKGGEFLMDSTVPVWISSYGSASGRALMSATIVGDKVVLLTKEID